jgi:hypothetical protein
MRPDDDILFYRQVDVVARLLFHASKDLRFITHQVNYDGPLWLNTVVTMSKAWQRWRVDLSSLMIFPEVRFNLEEDTMSGLT